MREIPVCPRCKQYYIPSTGNDECSYCSNSNHLSEIVSSPKITELNKKLFNLSQLANKRTNIQVHPPPVPRSESTNITELSRSINLEIKPENQIDNQSKQTVIFRRGIILVFEPQSFELFLQQTWIKKILINEIQIVFERKFSNEQGEDHTIVTIFRLKILYANLFKNDLAGFLKEKTIHDEMSFRLTNAFVVVKDEPISSSWLHFINKTNQKYIYYLTRDYSNPKAHTYPLMESETLFLSLIKRMLIIQDQIDISIREYRPVVRIKENNLLLETTQEYKTSNLEISGVVTNCMGHGGPIEEYFTCEICGGSLCQICVESFLICPGSISTDLHKFIKK